PIFGRRSKGSGVAGGREGKMRMLSHRWWVAEAAVVIAVSAVLGTFAFAASSAGPARAGGLGETTGILPRDHLTLESAIQVDLSKETVRLPLYRAKRTARPSGTCSWTPPMPGWRM